MPQGGLDTRGWLTILGVFVLFFVLPACTLEYDRRKDARRLKNQDQSQANRQATVTSDSP